MGTDLTPARTQTSQPQTRRQAEPASQERQDFGSNQQRKTEDAAPADDSWLGNLTGMGDFYDAGDAQISTTNTEEGSWAAAYGDDAVADQVKTHDGTRVKLGGDTQLVDGKIVNAPGGETGEFRHTLDPANGNKSKENFEPGKYGKRGRRTHLEANGDLYTFKYSSDRRKNPQTIIGPDGRSRAVNGHVSGEEISRTRYAKDRSSVNSIENFVTGEKRQVNRNTDAKVTSATAGGESYAFEYTEGRLSHMVGPDGQKLDLPQGTKLDDDGVTFTQDETVDGEVRGIRSTFDFKTGEWSKTDAGKEVLREHRSNPYALAKLDELGWAAKAGMQQGDTWALDVYQQRLQELDRDATHSRNESEELAHKTFQETKDPELKKRLAPYALSWTPKYNDRTNVDTLTDALELTTEAAHEGNDAAIRNLADFVDTKTSNAYGDPDIKQKRDLIEQGENRLRDLATGDHASTVYDALATETAGNRRGTNPQSLALMGLAGAQLDTEDPRRQQAIESLTARLDAEQDSYDPTQALAAMEGLANFDRLDSKTMAAVGDIMAQADPKMSLAANNLFHKNLNGFEPDAQAELVRDVLDQMPASMQKEYASATSREQRTMIDGAFGIKMKSLEPFLTKEDYSKLRQGEFTPRYNGKPHSRDVNATLLTSAMWSGRVDKEVTEHIFTELKENPTTGAGALLNSRVNETKQKSELNALLQYTMAHGTAEDIKKVAEGYLPKPKPKPLEKLRTTGRQERQSWVEEPNSPANTFLRAFGRATGNHLLTPEGREAATILFNGQRPNKRFITEDHFDPNTNEVQSTTQEVETDLNENQMKRQGDVSVTRRSTDAYIAKLLQDTSPEARGEMAARDEHTKMILGYSKQLFDSGESYAAEHQALVRDSWGRGMAMNAASEGLAELAGHKIDGLGAGEMTKELMKGGVDGLKERVQAMTTAPLKGEKVPLPFTDINHEYDVLQEVLSGPAALKYGGSGDLKPLFKLMSQVPQNMANGKLPLTPGNLVKSGGDAVSDIGFKIWAPKGGSILSSVVKDGIVTPSAAIADYGAFQALEVADADNRTRAQNLRTAILDAPAGMRGLMESLQKNDPAEYQRVMEHLRSIRDQRQSGN